MIRHALTVALTLLAITGSAFAQEAELPRLPDGQPDVRGHWDAQIGGTYSLTNPSRGQVGRLRQEGKPVPKNPSRIVDPADGEIPYLPWARAKQQEIEGNIDHPTRQTYIDPQARCLPIGPIRHKFWRAFRIVQYPGSVVFLHTSNQTHQIIPLDSRPPLPDQIKLWMGDARGHWEGNTLVVEIRNNNAKSRLSNVGDFASDQVTIVERYTFLDRKQMRYEATLTDPSVYSRPWTIASNYKLGDPHEEEVWEEACFEGERNADNSLQK